MEIRLEYKNARLEDRAGIGTAMVYQGPLVDILSQFLTGKMVRDFSSQF